MANILTGRRILYFLLGLLLISGAALAVMAFNGENIFRANPESSQPSNQALEQNLVVPVTGAGVEGKAVSDPYLESGYGCNHDTAENPIDW